MNNYIPMIEETVVDRVDPIPAEGPTQEMTDQRLSQVPARTAIDTGPLPWTQTEEIDALQARWNAVQVEFVDQPRASVEQADALVVEVLGRIANALATNRAILNDQWSSQQDISTENLRVVLQNYRSFFNRLLAL